VKVLRIIARLNVGGPAHQVGVLSEGLARHGCDTLVVHGVVAPGEADGELAVRARHVRTLRLPSLRREPSLGADLVSWWRLLSLMREFEPDVVHTHTAKAGALGRLAALVYNATQRRSRRALVVHTFHGHVLSGYFGVVGSQLVRLAEWALALAGDIVLTLSERQQHDIVHRFRVAWQAKVRVVPPAVDIAPLLNVGPPNAAARAAHRFPPDAFVIGYVGRFAPIKDLGTLVRAFATVAERLPHARLLLVGGGETRASLERETMALGVSGRVVFAGWLNTLAAVYEACDVVALSSLNEGTPLALIEAMAAGRPVVATAVGGVPDLVEEGVTGLLVPAGDSVALAAALVRLGEDECERAKMGTAGRARARVHFDPARATSEVMRVYSDSLTAKRGHARRAAPLT
jgi:glycosyltransferase involved in cell wall biosynthesis